VYLAYVLAGCNMTAYKSSNIALSLYAIKLGASPFTIGTLVSMYAVLPMLLALSAGKVSDRFGTWRPMLLGSIGVAAGLLLPYFVRHLAALYASSAMMGGSFVFYNVAVQNMLGAASGERDRAATFSTYGLVIAAANFVGPLATGYSIDHLGHPGTYLVLAVLPMCTVLLLGAAARMIPTRAPGSERRQGGRTIELLRNAPFRRVLITSGVVLTGTDLFTFYMPIHGHGIGLSATAIGAILSTYAAAALTVRSLIPRLIHRLGEERLLTLALALASVTYLGFPFLGHAVPLAAAAFVLGLGLGCGQPLSMLLTYNRAPAGRSGEALGMRLTVNNFTHVIVPLLFGLIGSSFGLVPVFWLNAAMLAGGGTLNLIGFSAGKRTR